MVPIELKRQEMSDQNSDDSPEDIDSKKKLPRLHLPLDMKGKKFLDIRCNEGFFCVEATRRGAQAVGLDENEKAIEAARRRSPNLDFRHHSWARLPEGQFDVILLSSALHYESRPEELLDRIAVSLTADGLFVLEAGAIPHPRKTWVEAGRFGENFLYPTLNLLMENMLSEFSVRLLGKSIDQKDDPVGRYVFHCRKYKSIVMVASGDSGIGKTTLAVELSKVGIIRFSVDSAVEQMAHNAFKPSGELFSFIAQRFDISRIDKLTKEIVDAGLGESFAQTLFRCMPKGIRLLIVEGYSLSFPEIMEPFLKLLKDARMKVWRMSSSAG